MDKPAISVKNVSMMFNLNRDKIYGIKEYVVKALQRQLFFDEFWALTDVSFEVGRGEVFGIVGFNGAGKSTLLKLISGIFKPTKGTVEVNGEVAPLLELGTGFDPEFSARENIYMHGAMFGRSPAYMKEIYDEIMEFSELWGFEDVPIKNYSSGMISRLGFAVATAVNPDILIVDEILGAGDFRFVEKSASRIANMIASGATILLVSHDISTIRALCKRAMLLQKGNLIAIGDVNEICDMYQQGEQEASAG